MDLAQPVLLRRPSRTPALPMSPRVSWGADPRTALVFSWSTEVDVGHPGVEIGVDDGLGRTVAAETMTVPGWGVRYHHAVVDGLEAGTAYQYRCRHDGAATPLHMVRTAPAGSESFTFAAFGDQGTDGRAAAVLRVLQAATPAFTFCLGDLCYADASGGAVPSVGVDHAAWDHWLGMLSRATGAEGGLLPVVGNHEIEGGMGERGYDGFLARFPLPDNGVPGLPTTWVARWGNVALVAADANDVSTEITCNNGMSGGRQDAWLDATLCGLRSDPAVDWIVVGFHQSAYSTNTLHGSDLGVRSWVPLFDRHGVDLVINGHNHCYERTHPMLDGRPVAEVDFGGGWWSAGGITYLCAGGGGGRTHPMSPATLSTVHAGGGLRILEAAPWSAFRHNDHSLLLIDITPPDGTGATSLTVRAVDAYGLEIDRFTLLRSGVPVS